MSARFNDLDTVKAGDFVIVKGANSLHAKPQSCEVFKVGRSLIHVRRYSGSDRTAPFRKDTGYINQDPGHSRILTDKMVAWEEQRDALLKRLEKATGGPSSMLHHGAVTRLGNVSLAELVELFERVAR